MEATDLSNPFQRLVRFWPVYHASALDECRHQGNNGGSGFGPRRLVLEQHTAEMTAAFEEELNTAGMCSHTMRRSHLLAQPSVESLN